MIIFTNFTNSSKSNDRCAILCFFHLVDLTTLGEHDTEDMG